MTLYAEDFKEGQACPLAMVGDDTKPCPGKLVLAPSENCSCHISPPCGSCLERVLTCDVCAWEVEDVEL